MNLMAGQGQGIYACLSPRNGDLTKGLDCIHMQNRLRRMFLEQISDRGKVLNGPGLTLDMA